MGKKKALKAILSDPKGLSPAIKKDWERQKRTAEEIVRRFEDGRRTVLVADEVGMGKTYVALAAMAQHIFQSEKNDRRVLLVMPTSAVLAAKWKQEILTFNEIYLKTNYCNESGRTMRKQLRPLVVRDYWELVQSLHDYDDINVRRVGQEKREYFTFLFCEWYNRTVRKSREQKKEWQACKGIVKDTPGLLDFCSFVSPNTLDIFLSEWYSRDPTLCNKLVERLNKDELVQGEISTLYRNFCAQQDAYEPNIFIVSMGMLQRESRKDNENMQLLCTYLVGRLMRGRYEKKKPAAYAKLKGCEMIAGSASNKNSGGKAWCEALADINLWGLKGVIDQVIRESKGELPSMFLNLNSPECKGFLVGLKNDILRRKLADSGVTLAVVDEVHNWKNGNSNGAKRFRDDYAPFIPYKLIMSATPFQLHVDELDTVFKIAAGVKASGRRKAQELPETDDESARIVAAITADNGPAKGCLDASKKFSDAWESLTQEQIRTLSEALEAQPDVEKTVTRLCGDTLAPHALHHFCEATLHYHKSLKCYEEALATVVIRHTKDKDIRRFHNGKDFTIEGEPLAAVSHTALYESKGYGPGASALLDAIGMRTQQRIRRAVGDTGGVRLLGGLNSSYEAFKASWKGQGQEKALDAATQAYTDLFVRLLEGVTHPKVHLTVERAVCNYHKGRKTLIFCERRHTQTAIENKIRQRLKERMADFDDLPKVRALVLRDFATVEYYLSRSIMEAQPKRIKPTEKQEDTAWKLMQDVLLEAKVEPLDDRQWAKLIDLCLVRVLFKDTPYGIFANILDDVQALAIYLRKKRRDVEDASLIIEDEETAARPATIQDGDEDVDRVKFKKIMRDILLERQKNIWCPFDDVANMHRCILDLFHSEAQQLIGSQQLSDSGPAPLVLAELLLHMPQGLRSILLRLDTLSGIKPKGYDLGTRIVQRLRDSLSDPTSSWRDTEEFLRLLCDAKGSIRMGTQASRRRSLWRGVFLRGQAIVQSMNGDTAGDTRVNLCAAFNSPLLPAVLLCTAVGSEGIDLHLQCAEVIHHDLPWNPAKLEQRTGRVDRVGSLAERLSCAQQCKSHIHIGIPFIACNYDEFQYNTLWSRAQKQEVLFGEPDYITSAEEHVCDEEGKERPLGPKPDDEVLPTTLGERLPEALMNFLKVDLEVVKRRALP